MAPRFRPGLELSRLFFEQAVRPVLADAFPDLRYSAARMGRGSEVLGHDTERSADHEWGPRLELFVADDEPAHLREQVVDVLAGRLPGEFLGWSTHFEPEDAATRRMSPADGPVRHRVGVTSVGAWCDDLLGFDPRAGVTAFDWLATPGQRLAETTAGAVFHDGLDALQPLRACLRWYPPDVWRFVLAGQWRRVAQEEACAPRSATTSGRGWSPPGSSAT